MKNNRIEDIVRIFRSRDNFLLSTHVHPDGDGVGAELALAMGLRQLKKNVTIVNNDPFPQNYSFLLVGGLLKEKVPKHGNFEVGVSLECSDPDRLGRLKDVFETLGTIVNIDHHPSNEYFGDYNYVQTEACAVGEQIYDILKRLRIKIDKRIAECIYTSILTDTGSFSYSNTTVRTHEIIVELLGYGVNPTEVYQNVYEASSVGKVILLGKILGTLELSLDKKIAWVSLTRKMFADTETDYEDAEGMINYARSIKSVEAAISFTELKNGKIKVSFRSKSDKVDVNLIAAFFGGGGHTRASGCVVDDNMKNTQEKVIRRITRFMKEAGL
ncbi:MAG: bifunctional oligoribonuclease/PAP phosphatase NrnA [Candidatus Firestonebacteria bacterium]